MTASPYALARRRLAVTLALAAGLLAASPGCVKSRCTRNSECASGLVCMTDIGACRAPECTVDTSCPDGQVCKGYACVAGCRTREDCAAGSECFDQRCVPVTETCDCPAAPRFCGTDRNPASPSGGDEVCIPEDRPEGVLLFFGSLGCSHCRAIFAELVALQGEAGAAARLAFVQLGDLVVDPAEVASVLGSGTATVLQDTAQHALWNAYAADWYHAVLVDRNGCLANHWGPLAGGEVSDTLHDVLLDAWKGAAEAVCVPRPSDPSPEAAADDPSPEPVPEAATPDLPPEAMPDTIPDATPDPGPVPEAAPEPVPETSTEPIPETVPVVESFPESAPEPAPEPVPEPVPEPAPEPVPDVLEASVGDVVEPFTLGPVCQVAVAAATVPGQKVAHFLCADANTTSAGYGTGVSDWLLDEIVWIAYFGACT